jgi:hypothetical protein
MVIRALSIGAVTVAMVASAAMGAGWTERLQSERMTVVQIDPVAGRFQCAEHQKWTAVAREDLESVHQGDIVRVDSEAGRLPRLVVLRSAADELASPE